MLEVDLSEPSRYHLPSLLQPVMKHEAGWQFRAVVCCVGRLEEVLPEEEDGPGLDDGALLIYTSGTTGRPKVTDPSPWMHA